MKCGGARWERCGGGVRWIVSRGIGYPQLATYVTNRVTWPPGFSISNAIWTSSVDPNETRSPSSSLYFTLNGPSSLLGPQSRIFLPTRSTRSLYSVARGTWMTKISSWKWTLTLTFGLALVRLSKPCDREPRSRELSLDPYGVMGEA